MTILRELHQEILSCNKCPLFEQRTQAVPGEGSSSAQLMFVGEAPGFQEDLQGRPFVGPAGRLLDKLLNSVGLHRDDVFITNVVKCRPPHNRDPFPGEITACSHFLEQQTALIQPKIVVPLGRHALANWFPGESISKVRAKPRQMNGSTILPLYHPAAALHNPALRETVQHDFQEVARLLREPMGRLSELVKEPVTNQAGQQLSML